MFFVKFPVRVLEVQWVCRVCTRSEGSCSNSSDTIIWGV